MLNSRLLILFSAAVSAVAAPNLALAAEQPLFLNAPARGSAPAPGLAVEFSLKLHLPEGRGLARLLLDAGVDEGDAGQAAKLAAGHMGSGAGGCEVKVSVTRSSGDAHLRLVRVSVATQESQTVIERRGADLAIASTGAARVLQLV